MAEGGTEGVLCRYFSNGACREGTRCLFSHDRSMSREDTVCRYYLKGECAYGARCRYDHIRTKPRTGSGGMWSGQGSRASSQGSRSQLGSVEGAALASSSSVNRTPHTGPLTVLKKNNESSWSGDPTCKTVHSSSWADAPEFVPKSVMAARASKSYASIVKPEGSTEKPSKEASLPLCPYELTSSGCPFGAKCTYLHGQPCDLCQKPCLHPYNEDQRAQHREECVRRHEQDMELSFAIQRSVDKCCGICMDVVMEKEPASERRFGILEKCNHIFCLNCIRKWRGTKHFDSKTVRSCPECRVPSDFVTPSSYWVDMGEEKDKLIANYKTAMSAKPCRYFQEGRGECPFAGACFYQHMYPDGRKAVMPPPQPRRRQNHNGDLEIMERLYLWDFLDVADSHMFAPFNLEEVFEILSETEDSDSDWSDIDILLN